MCRLLRWTVSRATRCTGMRARVWRERRMRWTFFVDIIGSLLLLRFFDGDVLADVADALALVRLGRAQRANFSRHLPDRLAVSALDDDFGLRGAFDLHAGGHVLRDRVRVADLQVQLAALGRSAEADADQRQALFEPLRDATHH